MQRRTFIKSRMDKQADERLLQDGLIRDALNIRISGSEGSNSGAIENCLGNEKLTNLNIPNAITLGVKEDDKSEKIYWLITSDTKEGLLEWDKNNPSVVTWVLEENISSNSVLKLAGKGRINDIDIIYVDENIGNLIFWSQLGNPPRMNLLY